MTEEEKREFGKILKKNLSEGFHKTVNLTLDEVDDEDSSDGRKRMICRYCADTLRVVNEKLFSTIGEKCGGNPKGFHTAVSDGSVCVYCGNPVTCRNGKPYTKYGTACKNSPTAMHCLQ